MSTYKLYTDGGSRGNPGKSAIGCILFDDADKLVDFDAKYCQISTNNQAEYIGLITGLELSIKNSVNNIIVFMDSELIVKQINGEYKVKNEEIIILKANVDKLLKSFDNYKFIHIERNKNKFADKLVNIVLDNHNI
jgi:ribonuclease HI